MSFAAPWALLALAALPVLVWLHRRRRRAPPREIPSLLFLKDELESHPPRRRWMDLDLLLALVGAAALALAAAAPGVAYGPRGRLLRVVVSGGAPGRAVAPQRDRALAEIRDAMGPGDRLALVEPAGGADDRRPSAGRLVDAALAGDASWRAVLSDAPPPPDVPVAWIRIGRPDLANVGIVAATLVEEDGGWGVFAVVENASASPRSVRLRLGPAGAEPRLGAVRTMGPDDTLASTMPVLAGGTAIALTLADASGGPIADAVPEDDAVRFERRALRVWLGPDLPPAHRRLVLDAFAAALGPAGVARALDGGDLAVVAAPAAKGGETPAGSRRVLVLFPIGDGPALYAPAGPDFRQDGPLVRDLSSRGTDLAYAPDALRAHARPLLWRGGPRPWPIVAESGRRVLFLPDPLVGRAPPAETPLWPLFVDDLVAACLGVPAGGAPGWRRLGLLDEATTRLGREATPPEEVRRMVAAASRDRPAPAFALRLPLVLAALVALLLLWVRIPSRS